MQDPSQPPLTLPPTMLMKEATKIYHQTHGDGVEGYTLTSIGGPLFGEFTDQVDSPYKGSVMINFLCCDLTENSSCHNANFVIPDGTEICHNTTFTAINDHKIGIMTTLGFQCVNSRTTRRLPNKIWCFRMTLMQKLLIYDRDKRFECPMLSIQ